MRRTALFLAAILLALPSFAGRQVIPVAGHLPGAAGTEWTTDVTLTNTTSSVQDVELRFHPREGTTFSRHVTLQPLESVLLRDAVAPEALGSGESSWLGLLEIDSPGAVKATSRTFTGAGTARGTYGSSYEAIDPTLMTNRGVITGILSNARFRTNVAFANADNATRTFTIRLRDAFGSLRAVETLVVPAMTTSQIPLAPLYTTDDDTALSVEWLADGRGYAVASVVDNGSGDPTAIASAGHGSHSMFFPVVGKTPGASNTFWTTSVAVTSDSDFAGKVTFRFASTDATLSTTPLDLPPRGTIRVADAFSLFGLPTGSGFLTVESDVPAVAAVRVFNSGVANATYGSAVRAQERVVRATRLRIRGVRRDVDYRLNVGIANDDTREANGEIRLYDEHGTVIETQGFTVPAGTSIQIPFSGTAPVSGGEVEIEVENEVPVIAIASNVDNRSGDTTVTEVEQENERQYDIRIVMTPRTAATNETITMSASVPGLSGAAFAWDFGDGTRAIGANVTKRYAAAGQYHVTVTASFAGGAELREIEDVTIVSAGTSVFDFTFTPASPRAGQTITFTATGLPTGGTVKWEFPGVTRIGNPVTHTFAAAGNYQVEAEVERQGASTLRVSKLVSVVASP